MINYKKWLIEDLQNLDTDRFAIAHLSQELETLNFQMTAIRATSFDKMPAGNETQEDKLLTAIAKKDELTSNLEATKRHVADMEALLQALTDDERLIIERMVIKGEPRAADKLADELCFDRSNIYRKRDGALRELARRRFGVGYRP